MHFTYFDCSQWPEQIYVCEAPSIMVADQHFRAATGLNPLSSHITVRPVFMHGPTTTI
jgi:hypothetical protein